AVTYDLLEPLAAQCRRSAWPLVANTPRGRRTRAAGRTVAAGPRLLGGQLRHTWVCLVDSRPIAPSWRAAACNHAEPGRAATAGKHVFIRAPRCSIRVTALPELGAVPLAGQKIAGLPGEVHIVGIAFVAAAGIFAMGIVAGIVAVVSHGIHQEQQRYRQQRRFRDEHGIWAAPDPPRYFLTEEAPGAVTWAARRL